MSGKGVTQHLACVFFQLELQRFVDLIVVYQRPVVWFDRIFTVLLSTERQKRGGFLKTLFRL